MRRAVSPAAGGKRMTCGSLFAGIGGLDLGLERAGFTVRWQVEIDDYCRQVLAKHWPDVRRYEDVRAFPDDDTEHVDLVAGGFPCPPVSVAGKRRAQADARWLWPEFARVVRVLRPRFVLVENVAGLLSAGRGTAMGDVLGELAWLGYDAEWTSLPAAAIGAPHLRWRVFLVATLVRAPGAVADAERDGLRVERERDGEQHAEPGAAESRCDGAVGHVADANGQGELQQAGSQRQERGWVGDRGEATTDWRAAQSGVGGVFDGLPPQLDSDLNVWRDGWEDGVPRVATGVPHRADRLRGLGNAVVPQVAEWVGWQILARNITG